MTYVGSRQVEELKSEGHFFAAGALAKALGYDCSYGCHYGMRSEIEAAREAFKAGYDAAPVSPRR